MSEIQVDAAAQGLTFALAAGVGAALCLLYDLFRVLRLCRRPGRVGAFAQDLAWWAAAALATYGLMLVRCKGQVRVFALLGEGAGFLAARLTLSKAVMESQRGDILVNSQEDVGTEFDVRFYKTII